ncbi:MAG: M23 family metallopeptidase [Dehalococcoidia bacterium]|nr:M23 family metallopeptidase [Dehalococcoidia bacterium]
MSKVNGASLVPSTLSFSNSLPYVQIPTDKEMANLVAVQGPSSTSPASSDAAMASLQTPTSAMPADSPTMEKDYEVKSYEVVSGDTLSGIAQRFSISTDTVRWANNLKTDFLALGQELDIPPVSGTVHIVKENETAGAIASRYGVDLQAVTAFQGNHLSDPNILSPGTKLVIPGGAKPPDPPRIMVAAAPAPAPVAPSAPLQSNRSGLTLQWPASGPVSTYAGHKGTDIGAGYGAPVYSAEAGVVALAAELYDGYGLHIVVDHGNGFSTLYGHLSQMLVSPGQVVGRGAQIGKVGMTGRTSGAHLHFEVRYGGLYRNPLEYLP